MKKIISVILIFTLCIGFAGCGVQSQKTDKLQIVCTLFPQYDFVRQIVGDAAENTLLLPVGTESHAYEPTPADILHIADADVFIYIGDAMETWASGVMSEIDTSRTAVLNLSEALGLTLSAHAEHEHGTDPHIWTSPVNAMQMVEVIRDMLMELDADNAKTYADNAGIVLAQYKRLDASFRAAVENGARREIVFGSRFALRNFTEAYGLSYVAAFDSCTEESEPSAAVLASIMDTVREKQIPVVLYGELESDATASAIAAETGAAVRQFHSCHNLTQAEFDAGETYYSIMQKNLTVLTEALSA